jgi:hypothetical protein
VSYPVIFKSADTLISRLPDYPEYNKSAKSSLDPMYCADVPVSHLLTNEK